MIALSDLETIAYDLTDHVATVRLNRPDRMNALNPRAYQELEDVFRHIARDGDVRCVIITGTDPAFCAGEDVKEMMTAEGGTETAKALRTVRPKPTAAGKTIIECDRPVIAAINGAAVGWGMELSLFADIRIASDKAKMGEIFIKRGLIPDMGGMSRLPRMIGHAKAAELLFTGDVIDAKTAENLGIVSRVVAHEDLMDEARGLAARIAANPPLALRYLKEGLRRAYLGEIDDIGSWITSTYGVLFATEDHREGVQAFLEKREPIFKGR